MNGIELNVILEEGEKSCSPGDKIKGKVTVAVVEESRCEALELLVGVSGLADVNDDGRRILKIRDVLAKQLLFQGHWNPDLFAYPFEIEVPSAPATYRGRLIELKWHLKAEARLSRGKNAEAEARLTVIPGKEGVGDSRDGKPEEVVYRETPQKSLGCLGISLAVFLAGTLAAVKTFYSANETSLGIAVFFAVLGLVFIGVSLYTFLVGKRIGLAEARIGSGIVSPGDRVPCSLVFQVNKPVEIKEILVTLACLEEAGNVGIRASKRTFRKVVYEKKHALQLPDKTIPANVPIETRGEFSVPPDAHPSFILADRLGNGIALKWDVAFRLAMDRYPDWFYHEQITVVPKPPAK